MARKRPMRQIRVAPIAYWLARSAPRLHSCLRPLWRRIKPVLLINQAGDRRRSFRYYDEVVALARQYVSGGGSVLDVGAHDSDVLRKLDWFRRRVAVDIEYAPSSAGIEGVRTDFLRYHPPEPFDLIICLEVLEHLQDPQRFADKLLRSGSLVILSVPYCWPEGACPTHKQDPVDEDKLRRWTGVEPIESRIIAENAQRLIAVYRGLPEQDAVVVPCSPGRGGSETERVPTPASDAKE